MDKRIQFVHLDDEQRLNFINSSQLYEAWNAAWETLSEYRHGMRWVESKGKRYLVRLMDSKGYGRSLGPENEKTLEIFKNFNEGKERAKNRYKSLSERLARQARINSALKMARIQKPVARILSVLNQTKLDKDFIIIGTHALFAYEAMAGVYIESKILATQDLDFCFDSRRPLRLAIKKFDKKDLNGLLGLLKKVDKSYEPMSAHGGFRAVNESGFIVDIIIPERSIKENAPITFGYGDLVASEVPNLHWLVNAPKCREIVIAHNGMPLLIQVPDPRAFALHKAWLSQNPERNPVKRTRDRNQAEAVVSLIGRYLPQYPFEPSQLKYLSKDMIQLATEVMPPSEDEYDFLADLRLLDKRESPRS